MSPIPSLIATGLLLGACAALALPPPADPVIGWARVEFDANGITRAQAGGYADLATMRPMTIDDPVRVASVSKLVVAIGVLRLVEAGTLDLDADVSEYLGWRLRNPAFPDTVITLRHLLGHRSGIRDDAGYALPLDADLAQWMQQPGAWNSEYAPGQWFSYANLNFPVVAAVMEGATGERFDRIMQAQVFEPLGLDACFNWTTCSEATRARAVILYEPDGTPIRDTLEFIAAGCPATPASDGTCDLATYVLARNGAAFSPQGGLRISARDLARIGRSMLQQGPHQFDLFEPDWQESGFIDTRFGPASPFALVVSTHGQMTPSYMDTEDGLFCQYALGFHALVTGWLNCNDDLFETADLARYRQYAGHSGEAYGLRSGLWFEFSDGTGVAYFATGLPEEGALSGNSAFTAIEERLAQGLPVETVVPEGE